MPFPAVTVSLPLQTLRGVHVASRNDLTPRRGTDISAQDTALGSRGTALGVPDMILPIDWLSLRFQRFIKNVYATIGLFER